LQHFNLTAGRTVGHSRERCSSGLLILSTEKLTAPERDLLRSLARQHKLAVDLLNEAIDRNRVDGALESLEICSTLALLVQHAKIRMGDNR
jgi:hypothetical protein